MEITNSIAVPSILIIFVLFLQHASCILDAVSSALCGRLGVFLGLPRCLWFCRVCNSGGASEAETGSRNGWMNRQPIAMCLFNQGDKGRGDAADEVLMPGSGLTEKPVRRNSDRSSREWFCRRFLTREEKRVLHDSKEVTPWDGDVFGVGRPGNGRRLP